ncbi:MAG: YCF48-related protein [Candidatus Eiseniibacteriota bacterium]
MILGVALFTAWAGGVTALAPAAVAENVTVTLTPYNPPINLPHSGGSFGYNVQVGNDEAGPLTFDVWTTYTLPNGGGTQTGYGPEELTLPAGWSAQEDLIQDLSGGLPAGTYTYTTYAGVYPDLIWASDSFEFAKLSGTIGWYAQSPGAEYGVTGMSFVDVETGWAVTTAGEIIHTANGGDTWNQQDDGQQFPHQYQDVCFVNAQTGWLVGDGYSLGGTILHTDDEGATWTEQPSATEYTLNAVDFVDAQHGWAVGGFVDLIGSDDRRVIVHTSDGTHWSQQYWASYSHPLQDVDFADPGHGWAVGGSGGILYTANGGGSWNPQSAGIASYLSSVCFVDAETGWCVGDDGAVIHTTDGGIHWQMQDSGVVADLQSVTFLDAMTGWIAGKDMNLHPVILHTVDGGQSWEPQDPGTGSEQVNLRAITFVDANHGWAGGSLWPNTGAMLHTENGGLGTGSQTGVSTSRAGAPERASVSAPYPNPFNPRTSIRYVVPGDAALPVAITIFDERGRLIRRLVDGTLAPGEHVAAWDGTTETGGPAASGVYLYRSTVGAFETSGKLTLLR